MTDLRMVIAAVLICAIQSQAVFSQAPTPAKKTTPADKSDLFTPPLQHVTLKDTMLTSVAYSPDGKSLYTAGWDNHISVWDLDSMKKKAVLKGHTQAVRSIAVSPDGNFLVSGSGVSGLKANEAGDARLWDLTTNQEMFTLLGHQGRIWAVAFSPDGKTLATAAHDGTAKVWDAATGKELMTLEGHAGSLWCVAYSPDGKLLATGASDRTVRLWDLESGKSIAVLKGHTGKIDTVAFSPDGALLASGGKDFTVRIWDVKSGKQKAALSGHTNTIRDLRFSSDGKTLISSSGEAVGPANNKPGDIMLWNVATGALQTAFHAHRGVIYSIAVSPDGNTLASVSYDKTIKLWDLTTPVLHLEPHVTLIEGVRIIIAISLPMVAGWPSAASIARSVE